MAVQKLKSDPHFDSIGQASLDVLDSTRKAMDERVVSDPYKFWNDALAMAQGRQLTREQSKTLGVTMEPQSGFYRKRNKNGADIPIAIWIEDGTMLAKAGGQMVDADEIWTWCCSWPIHYETYKVVDDGKAWPDDAPVAEAVPGHNMPEDPHEAAKIEFAGEKELAEEFLKKPITTQAQADQASAWSRKLADLHSKVDKMFRAEKDPIVTAGREVDEKFRWREEAKSLSVKLKRAQDNFLNEQERLEAERQRKARAEEQRLQREAEEKARKVAEEANKVSDEERARLQREADEAAAAAAAKAREAEAQKVSAGRTGARVSLRTFVDAEITDYDKLVVALKDRQEMKELVQSLANRAAKAGVELDGMKIRSERRAA